MKLNLLLQEHVCCSLCLMHKHLISILHLHIQVCLNMKGFASTAAGLMYSSPPMTQEVLTLTFLKPRPSLTTSYSLIHRGQDDQSVQTTHTRPCICCVLTQPVPWQLVSYKKWSEGFFFLMSRNKNTDTCSESQPCATMMIHQRTCWQQVAGLTSRLSGQMYRGENLNGRLQLWPSESNDRSLFLLTEVTNSESCLSLKGTLMLTGRSVQSSRAQTCLSNSWYRSHMHIHH